MTATIPGFSVKKMATLASADAMAADITEESHLKPDYRAIYTSSILAVAVLFLVGVGLPISMYLDSWSAGFGLGAFCAFWGGPSFGVMVGAARVSAWLEANTDDH